MDERTRQFKECAEASQQLSSSALTKEINTLRKFLFRNQEYRFTKSEQQYLFLAVTTHCNTFLKSRPADHETNYIGLVDDALKMPFTVFSSAHKDKMLSLYYLMLKDGADPAIGVATPAPGPSTRELELLDMDQKDLQLSLLTEDGDEYDRSVAVSKAVFREMKKSFDEGCEIAVTVREEGPDAPVAFVSYALR